MLKHDTRGVSTEAHDLPARVMFLYWGRRGALTRFTFELAKAALGDPTLKATISISRHNTSFDAYRVFGPALFPVTTFRTNIGAVTNVWKIPRLCARLRQRLKEDQTTAVVDLMPHVWSPLIAPTIKALGVRYVAIAHDADRHPGDPTALVKEWIDKSLDLADVVVTLSSAVARRLEALGRIRREKLATLFHPHLNYSPALNRSAPAADKPIRLLFLGRILTYKGLPLFLDAVDILRESGLRVEVGVFGEGPLGASASRLKAINAEVVNRWLTDEEIGAIFHRFHAIVLSHTEASQSGVAAAALGAGLPLVVTPVGGLVEQVSDGRTGIVALRTDATALSRAIKSLLLNPTLYKSICETIAATKDNRSMARFARECATLATRAGQM